MRGCHLQSTVWGGEALSQRILKTTLLGKNYDSHYTDKKIEAYRFTLYKITLLGNEIGP